MDHDSIERVRTATFAVTRRGYDQREVDRFLARLADWLESGGGDESRAQVIRDELERIGEQTAKILTNAHEIANEMREEADHHATTVRSEADAYAERVRIEADEYSKEQRAELEAHVGRIRSEAQEEAAALRDQAEKHNERLAEEVAVRRRELEAEIAELEHRRESVLEGIQQLSSTLAGTATQYRPGSGTGPFYRPADRSASGPVGNDEDSGDESTEMIGVGGAEEAIAHDDEGLDEGDGGAALLDVDDAEFESDEDEVEDEDVAGADGATMEFDVQGEVSEPYPGEEEDRR